MTKQELELCINEYGKDIYSFCKYLTYNEQDADDLYQLLECNNVENLADELYICVIDSMFYNARAYQYDEVTGEISRNEEYEGLNALFVLPIEE